MAEWHHIEEAVHIVANRREWAKSVSSKIFFLSLYSIQAVNLLIGGIHIQGGAPIIHTQNYVKPIYLSYFPTPSAGILDPATSESLT